MENDDSNIDFAENKSAISQFPFMLVFSLAVAVTIYIFLRLSIKQLWPSTDTHVTRHPSKYETQDIATCPIDPTTPPKPTHWSKLIPPQYDLDDGNDDPLPDVYGEPVPPIRSMFTGGATIVYAWPSTGGIWVKDDCYAVELDLLGISRFEESETRRGTAPAEEDEFCRRVERIGGRFYADDYVYNEARDGNRRELRWWYAWEGGGVWVLRTEGSQGAEIGVSRIRNAVDMEERCRAVEMLGGKFYERWEDVPRLEDEGMDKEYKSYD